MLRLFTSYYNERQPARRAELEYCLHANLALPVLDEVCLLVENCAPPRIHSDRLVTFPVTSRPTYRDFFHFANSRITSADDVTVIANSDISLTESIAVLATALHPSTCAALSRWNSSADGRNSLYDRNDSQDTWVFRGMIRPEIVADYPVGIPRCDNRILHELRAAGYEVINPAFSIRTLHRHDGPRTEYPAIIDGPHVAPPYAYLYPHNLWGLPATLIHNLRPGRIPIGWRPDWRRLSRILPLRVVRRLLRTVAPPRKQ